MFSQGVWFISTQYLVTGVVSGLRVWHKGSVLCLALFAELYPIIKPALKELVAVMLTRLIPLCKIHSYPIAAFTKSSCCPTSWQR